MNESDDRELDAGEVAETRAIFEELGVREPPEPSSDLLDRTLTQVRAEITAGDIVELTTSVLVLNFFAPILDLVISLSVNRAATNAEDS